MFAILLEKMTQNVNFLLIDWTINYISVLVTLFPGPCVSVYVSRHKIQTTPFLPHHCLLQQPDSLRLSVSDCIIALNPSNSKKLQNLSMSFKRCASQTVSLVVISGSYQVRADVFQCISRAEPRHRTMTHFIAAMNDCTCDKIIYFLVCKLFKWRKSAKPAKLLSSRSERADDHVSKRTSGVVRKQVMRKRMQWKVHACLNMTTVKLTDGIFERNESHSGNGEA